MFKGPRLSGEIFGIPYDFSIPTLRKIRKRWWNKEDPRIIVPKTFGLGFDINLYQLQKREPLLFRLFLLGIAGYILTNILSSKQEKNTQN